MGTSLLAAAMTRTYFELARLQTMQRWWHWPLFLLVLLLVAGIVVALYRRDTAELARPTRWLLSLLRLMALIVLVIFFLGIEKRTEHRIVKNSRAVLAVDTSQSMGLIDLDDQKNAAGLNRAEQVASAFADQGLIDRLRKQHDVIVYKFDDADQPKQIASLPCRSSQPETADETTDELNAQLTESRLLAAFGSLLVTIAVAAAIVGFWRSRLPRTRAGENWSTLITIVAVILAAIVFGTNHLRNPNLSFRLLFSERPAKENPRSRRTNPGQPAIRPAPVNWRKELQPGGVATKLGSALQFIVGQERGGPIAGICLFSDGNVNAGIDWREALRLASEAEISVFTIGLGSDLPPSNVRVVDVDAPARVYPGDAFHIKAFLQAFALSGQSVQVRLSAAEINPADNKEQSERLLEERRIALGNDGAVQSIEFACQPTDVGKVRYTIRVLAPPGDVDSTDNQQTADIHVVDRKTKVLLFAGGPTREYNFVRSLCFRDAEITSHVYLQGAPAEIAQDADAVLTSFPSFPAEMFDFDCLLAFDPDWLALDENQIELLERWVAEKAGGLILIAGPVYTPEWSSLARPRAADQLIRALFPVTFYQRAGRLLSRGRYAATQPWPIEFSEDGLDARFLWLADSGPESAEAWSQFEGVYGYQPVRGAKPGAIVYGRFSNPESEIDGEFPVLFAGQFYGAGRVFYVASGEMWRLNEVDTNYFDQFYTKLIRYVSEGRLLRDSSRGTLLVSKDRCVLGETIVVRASLSDPQFRPLDREQVEATTIRPDGARLPLVLQKVREAGQEGSYTGQFAAGIEGDYRVELIIPDSADLEILTKTVRARMPDREIESPQRNDALLSQLAQTTGGTYFVGLPAALGTPVLAGSSDPAQGGRSGRDGRSGKSERGLADVLLPQNQETYFPSTPDHDFQQRLMGWLMLLICGSLSLEWLIRRLYRLA